MATLNMGKAYSLNPHVIERVITWNSPGNYALGILTTAGTFIPKYVGRSDDNVKIRLKSWVGKVRVPHFKFSYALSAQDAFYKECLNYHDFEQGLSNQNHPARPNGTNLKCPRCKVFG